MRLQFFKQKQRSEITIEQIYEKYCDMIFLYAYSILHDKNLSEDAVQEVFERIIKYRPDIHTLDSQRIKSYLITICRNVCFDIYKRNNIDKAAIPFTEETEAITPDNGSSPEAIAVDNDTVMRVKEIIKGLDYIYRDIILLSASESLTAAQIAEQLNLPVETVKKRLTRARKIIKEQMIKEGLYHE